jgi:hypothetical protein
MSRLNHTADVTVDLKLDPAYRAASERAAELHLQLKREHELREALRADLRLTRQALRNALDKAAEDVINGDLTKPIEIPSVAGLERRLGESEQRTEVLDHAIKLLNERLYYHLRGKASLAAYERLAGRHREIVEQAREAAITLTAALDGLHSFHVAFEDAGAIFPAADLRWQGVYDPDNLSSPMAYWLRAADGFLAPPTDTPALASEAPAVTKPRRHPRPAPTAPPTAGELVAE